MKKVFQKTNIIATAIFCIAACALWAPSCFAEEWYGEPALIINQNPYTAQGVAAFQSIAQAYSSSSEGQALPAGIIAFGSGTQANEFQPSLASAAWAAPAVRSTPSAQTNSIQNISLHTGENTPQQARTAAATPSSIKPDANRGLKTCLSTQTDKNTNAFIDGEKPAAKNNRSNKAGEDFARCRKQTPHQNTAYARAGNTAETLNTLKHNKSNDVSDRPLAGTSNSIMQYRESLLKDQASFTQKTRINTVRKNVQSDAENLANAVSGVMPLLKHSLLREAKTLLAQDRIDLAMPPLAQPLPQQDPLELPEGSEAYKQSSIRTGSKDSICVNHTDKDIIDHYSFYSGFPDQILISSVNYAKTGLSPPECVEISHSLLLSEISLPVSGLSMFDCACDQDKPPLIQTVSNPNNNSIIDPPKRLRKAFYFSKNAISEASLNLNSWLIDSHCIDLKNRAGLLRTMRAISHPPEVWPS